MFARLLVGTIVGGVVLIAAGAGAVAVIGKSYSYIFNDYKSFKSMNNSSLYNVTVENV